MSTLLENIKGLLVGMKVTIANFRREPVTITYPWAYDKIPPNSRGMLRMVDFHDAQSIDHKSDWYHGTRWAPCISGCPAHTDARGYVTLAGEANWQDGLNMLRKTYPFVATLGRVCPAPCEKACNRGFTGPDPIAIRKLKRTFSDWEDTLPVQDRFSYEQYCCSQPLNGKSIGIIGGGPAGYQCAMLLRSWGFECHIYEMKEMPGGFLTLGIPLYRLPRPVVNSEMERIHSLNGIKLHLNIEIGSDITFAELEARHDEIIIAAGAWKPYRLELANEEKPWVWYGEDFLEEQITGRLTQVPSRVVVVGGGNTGFDCARTCRRLGSEVVMIYRRTRSEMPSENEEIEDGEEEGVELRWLTSPNKVVIENGQLKGMEVVLNRLGDKDRSGRRKPVPIKGSEHLIECGMIITALGREVDLPWIPKDITRNRNGTIKVDSHGKTTRDKVWACGDVCQVSTVINAIGQADRACIGIATHYNCLPENMPFLYNYEHVTPHADGSDPGLKAPVQDRLHGLGMQPHPPTAEFKDTNPWSYEDKEKPFRKMNLQVPMPKIPGPIRILTFDEHDMGFSLEMAQWEGRRCYGCSAEMCVGCGACVDACPDSCIHLESPHNANGREVPEVYSIDLARCCYCGLCTEACPTESLIFTSNFEMSVQEKQDTYLNKPRMNLGLVRLEKSQQGPGKSGLQLQLRVIDSN